MPGGSYAQNLLLAYQLQGSTATRVTAWSVGLSLGSPSQASLSEVGTGSGYARKAATFKSLAANTFVNSPAISFAAFSSAATISGAFVVNDAGSLLLFGTLGAATAVVAGSIGSFAASALTVLLV